MPLRAARHERAVTALTAAHVASRVAGARLRLGIVQINNSGIATVRVCDACGLRP
ncbi:MAG TPA: hypothetical protein VFB29_02310 [Pseudolabrys sp.]|nr:hypothetical protein [Pseudolabrys sp.]